MCRSVLEPTNIIWIYVKSNRVFSARCPRDLHSFPVYMHFRLMCVVGLMHICLPVYHFSYLN